jgi:hypothetical protein|nr:hypothetical protein [bacterium]
MKRKRTIYEGIIVLGLMILVTAHFMGLCVNGLCSDEWLIKNLMLGTAFEAFLFFYLHKFLKGGALVLYHETNNPELLIKYYKKIRGYSIIVGIYSVILWIQPRAIDEAFINGTILTSSILVFFALSVFVTTSLSINRINNRRS